MTVPKPDLGFVGQAVMPKNFTRLRAKFLQRKRVVEVPACDSRGTREIAIDQPLEAWEGVPSTGKVPEYAT